MAHGRLMAAGLAALALVAGGPARAEEAKAEPPKLGGYVESSYCYDFSEPSNNTITARSYHAQHNTFMTNAHIGLTGAVGALNYTVETDMGNVARVDGGGYGAPAAAFSAIDVQEAYVTFPDPLLSKYGVTDTVGKFVTYEGIEVVESPLNPTVTQGYLFGLAEPFTHVGAVKSVAMGPVTIRAGVVNGWDRAMDNNGALTGVAVVKCEDAKLGMVNLSAYSGADQDFSPGYSGRKKQSVDATGVFHLPQVELWWQYNYGDEKVAYDPATKLSGWDHWSGGGLQPVIKLNDAWSFGVRAEYFAWTASAAPAPLGAWRPGYAMPGVVALTNVTVTANWAMAQGLTGRIEVRHDDSDQDIFVANDPAGAFGGMRDDATAVTMQMVASF